jgi:hypothetical protein
VKIQIPVESWEAGCGGIWGVVKASWNRRIGSYVRAIKDVARGQRKKAVSFIRDNL